MNTWFDRRYCIICNAAPTSLANTNIKDDWIPQLFESESPSAPSTSPPTTTDNNHNHNHNHNNNTNTTNTSLVPISEDAITINFNNKPLTLQLPSLSNMSLNSLTNDDAASPAISIQSTHSLLIKPGTGPTFKCEQCFARLHIDCLEHHNNNISNDNNDNNTESLTPSQSPSSNEMDIGSNIICPVCIGNASISTQSNYNNLFESIEEEKNLLRDWSENECLACGDVGELICCDLCFYEHNDSNLLNINQSQSQRRATRLEKKRLNEIAKKLKEDTRGLFITGNISKLDGASQFHLKCVIAPNTEFCGIYIAPDPFICPLCTRQFGSNRLQSLHFFQRKRTKERERRMQEKAFKAQEYIKQIGFRVDCIKKCVFCRINSDDTAQGVFFDKENEFIGPFYDEERNKLIKYWAHYQCVMWSPQVFMNEFNEFCNVSREIKRSKGLTCSVCGKHGAVLGCYEKGCYNTYHYPCAKRSHCYFDNQLFAIYCPTHYFVHFLSKETMNNNIIQHRINGLNRELFEKCRFDQTLIMRKRKIAKSCKATDFCYRYNSTVDVWKFIINEKHKHSASSSISKEGSINSINSINIRNTTYMTRAKRKQIEIYENKKLEKKKKRYKKSLMSIGGRKRSRNYLDGNLVCFNRDEVQLSPHERKRRKVFNLQPMSINDKTLSIDIEPDKIDISDIVSNEYDMSSMVGGLDEAINVLKETVLLPLLYPELFKSFNLKPAKGVILYGPPGTGKTLLVRSLIKYYYAMSKAIFSSISRSSSPSSPITTRKSKSISISSPSPASLKNPNKRYNSLADAVLIDHKNDDEKELHKNESLISFFSRRGPDLLSKFHGETERNLRSLFNRAQECSPSIIFFDEIDGLCPIRSHKHEQVHNSVVATLLSLMDGIDSSNKEVFIIAATNRIDNLDSALRRPGRFDREIYIGIPNNKQRLKILKIQQKKWEKHNISDEYLKYIAINKTIGFSGADLNALCNEAFINCINRCCPQLKKSTNYNPQIAKQLKNNIIITIDDFEKTFNDGFKPSNIRNNNHSSTKPFNQQQIDNLDINTKNILDQLVERMDIYINHCKNANQSSVPLKQIHEIDDNNNNNNNNNNNYIRSINQARLLSKYNDKLLICSKYSDINKLLISYLLHKLDIANIQYISIPDFASTQTTEEAYHNILNKIKLSIISGCGVIVIYDLDIWLKFYPQIIENILLSNIKDMCRDRNTLILSTCNQEWNATNSFQNEWPQTVYQYFSSFKHNFLVQ